MDAVFISLILSEAVDGEAEVLVNKEKIAGFRNGKRTFPERWIRESPKPKAARASA